jgi:hypothetical protein
MSKYRCLQSVSRLTKRTLDKSRPASLKTKVLAALASNAKVGRTSSQQKAEVKMFCPKCSSLGKFDDFAETDFSEADQITAYQPDGGSAQSLAKYAQHLIETKGAKIINLAFQIGEVFFVVTGN